MRKALTPFNSVVSHLFELTACDSNLFFLKNSSRSVSVCGEDCMITEATGRNTSINKGLSDSTIKTDHQLRQTPSCILFIQNHRSPNVSLFT